MLPPSALQELQGASSPMLFEISDLRGTRRTHGGVLEFLAEEGRCYVPFWIIKQLQLQEGDRVRLRSKSLPKAKFVRFQPASVALMRVYNTRAMLEVGLRNYVALTVGDSITVEYNTQHYALEVLEARPSDAVCIVEADVELEFATPKDALPPPRDPVKDFEVEEEKPDTEDGAPTKATVFSGAGRRIDGLPVEPYTAEENDQGDSDDEMPWKQRIPGGVKWTSEPFGYTKQFKEAYNGKPEVVVAASSSKDSSGKMTPLASGSMSLPSGDFVSSSEESREAQHLAAAKRMADNADEIEANRRRLEQEAKEKAEQEAREQAKQEELKRKAEAKRKAALAQSAPTQQKMQPGNTSTKKHDPDSANNSIFCGCLRSKTASQSNNRV
eukprot:gnl/MRDRNA2_/MRDRNA2_131720_c0_seq1.p1 gnl/MRDRNA2_/MRDRNA2_131720_c0~~gnl/MRDRNA2_/MRDRNA2_131720_c0_seq1.p1  ORF type:complete len:395 (-),score=111.30 gnl/MRDRNA2_/MRDRNA2_131720_c0_seq1:179-1330(-)